MGTAVDEDKAKVKDVDEATATRENQDPVTKKNPTEVRRTPTEARVTIKRNNPVKVKTNPETGRNTVKGNGEEKETTKLTMMVVPINSMTRIHPSPMDTV
jgi:hypothetical protein